MPAGSVPKAPAVWLVAACAAIAAIAGPFVADLSEAAQLPQGPTGINYLNAESGPVLLIFLFGAPIPALVAASVAYSGLLLRRPPVFAVTAVLAGLVAAYLVGWETGPIAAWWLGYSRDSNRIAAVVASVLSLISVCAIGLAIKLPILRSAVSRRGAVAALLAVSLLCGLIIGLAVGPVAATVTALQDTCALTFSNCNGPNIEAALEEGALVGTWFGGALGLLAGAIVWAIPPWKIGSEPLSPPAPPA